MLSRPASFPTPWAFFWATHRSQIPLISWNILFYSAGAASILAISFFLGKVIDGLTAGHVVTANLLFIILLTIAYEAFYRIGHIMEIILRVRLRAQTKKVLFDHLQNHAFRYFSDRFAGEIAHKVAMCADAMERMVLIVTNTFFEVFAVVGISIGILGSMHVYYVFFLLVWAGILGVILSFLAKKMDCFSGEWAEQETHTTGRLVDTFSNIVSLKVYGRNWNTQKTHTQIDVEAKALRRLGWWDVLTFHLEGLGVIVLVIGLVGLSGFLYRQGALTVGELVTVSGIAFRLYGSVWEIGPRLAEFIRAQGEARHNLADIFQPFELSDGVASTVPSAGGVEIVYENVSFGYHPSNPVLKGFSLHIQPCEKVGLIGVSGAGKTTLVHLALRFFDVQAGKVTLNGENVRDLTQEALREHMSYISQDTSLFHTSIAENIRVGNEHATQEQIEDAARQAYAHDFITSLPHGYETVVGERGVKLSGGQRQRIAIARAILANRPLFLLDEATSALDSESEHLIQQSLAKLMEGKTVIAIAHRLSTLACMDRLVVLDKGQIVEDGTHTELLAKGGIYAHLWALQSGGFLPEE